MPAKHVKKTLNCRRLFTKTFTGSRIVFYIQANTR